MILEKAERLSIQDEEIGGRVLSNLKRSAVLAYPHDVRIAIHSGVVRLEGRVSFPAEKAMIGEIVGFTEGVLAVENALRILPCSERRPSS